MKNTVSLEARGFTFPSPYNDMPITKMRIHELPRGECRFGGPVCPVYKIVDGAFVLDSVEISEQLPIWVEGYSPVTDTWDEICQFSEYGDAVDWVCEITKEWLNK